MQNKVGQAHQCELEGRFSFFQLLSAGDLIQEPHQNSKGTGDDGVNGKIDEQVGRGAFPIAQQVSSLQS